MSDKEEHRDCKVLVSLDWWDGVQVNLQDAIGSCIDIASAIEAHQRNGKYNAEELLDMINSDVREIRNLLEEMVTPI